MKRNLLIAIILILLIGAGMAWYFLGRPGTGPENGNLANREPLPESHALTNDERQSYGVPEGIEGTVKYDYQEDGAIYSYIEVTSDTRPLDTDTDGIPDDQETEYGTDFTNPDTDADGWRDGDEVAKGTDPLKADTDGDGVGDYEEFSTYQTDPLKADTDGDGFDDGTEILSGHDPLDVE